MIPLRIFRMSWYWAYKRCCLFLGIVWRKDDPQCSRIDWCTAWEVAGITWGPKAWKRWCKP